MDKVISVILPTYNPNLCRLEQTLAGLKSQTLPVDLWELLIIDNNSPTPVEDVIDLSWHPQAKVISEPQQGLTYARVTGFRIAQADLVVLVDDDNVLANNYLEATVEIFNAHPAVGTMGGKSIPLFDGEQPGWLKEFYGNLALRDLGDQIILSSWDFTYPKASPIGAGMAIRKDALKSYLEDIDLSLGSIADRQGNFLSSGGDNDIVLCILKSGWQAGYFPSLSLTHIIPKERVEVPYLARLINNTNKSWIQVLNKHQINPWKKIPAWTAGLRKIKAWFTYRAWLSELNYIRWSGACGTYDGLSE